MSEELFTVWLFSSDDWAVKAVEGLPGNFCRLRTLDDADPGGARRRDPAHHHYRRRQPYGVRMEIPRGVTFRTPEMRALYWLAPSVV